MRRSSRSVSTLKTYEQWLKAFASWLDKESETGPVAITGQLIKRYL